MRFTSPKPKSGTTRWSRSQHAVVGLDFDGTLAPIVDDPDAAHIHPDAPEVLLDLRRSCAPSR